MMIKRWVLFAVLLGLLSAAESARACECMAKPTVLDSFESSDMIVATRLVSVDKTRDKQGDFDIGYIRSASMIVTKVYKGNAKPGREMKFAQGGGADCIWTFDESWIGEEFLFYVGKPSKGHPFFGDENGAGEPMYYAVTCGRSNSLKGAVDDLSYLQNIDKVGGKTRLSGRFGTWWSDGDFNKADIKLKIVGKSKSYPAKTDKNGFFEIYDLPPGEYDVSIEPPFGWKIDDYMVGQTSTGYERFDPRSEKRSKNQIPISIKKGRHTALDLIFDIDTAIKGRILSPAGKPMKDVCVTAVSTELKQGDYRGHSHCTNENGEFTIEEMAPGNYILVVNDEGRMSGNSPFGVVFYPGVTDYKNAGVISVEAGRYVTGRIIQIPQTVELVTVSGRFLFSDGKPVIDEWVKFVPDDPGSFADMSQKTDAGGKFTFRLPTGAAGKIAGEFHTYSGEFKNCAKLEEIIRSTGTTFYNAKTSVVDVDSQRPPTLLELTLPFPYCEKVKDER